MRKRAATPPTVWEAFNNSVVEISDEQAKNVLLASMVIIAAAWVAPYWGTARAVAYNASGTEGTIFEQLADAGSMTGTVAGATTIFSEIRDAGAEPVPEWVYVVSGVPTAIVESFEVGANDVLDISEPVSALVEFYEPGVSAVWNEWLNMMRDPGTPEF